MRNIVHSRVISKRGERQTRRIAAFTLAELLMAVLVISIIMVALAPVITKRMSDNIAIEINRKKGLEIFTNPGTYTFDVPIGINTLFIQGAGGGGGGGGAAYFEKTLEFKYTDGGAGSTKRWVIPTGVYEVEALITGAGGGGGGAAAEFLLNPNTSCGYTGGKRPSYQEYKIIRGADNGGDLCMFTENVGPKVTDGQWYYLNNWTHAVEVSKIEFLYNNPAYINNFTTYYRTCVGDQCCWNGCTNNGNKPYWDGSCQTRTGSYPKSRQTLCTYEAANILCRTYADASGEYRLPTANELNYVSQYLDIMGRNPYLLKLCANNYSSTGTGKETDNNVVCNGTPYCLGAAGSCGAHQYWTNQSTVSFIWNNKIGGLAKVNDTGRRNASSGRCVRPLVYYKGYSGAGGASGAQYKKTIKVLPADVFEVTIGEGGKGGKGGFTTNGKNLNGQDGSNGGTTELVHKRGTETIGIYRVKGGLGGLGAKITTSGSQNNHGKNYNNSTASNGTTPPGTCSVYDKESSTDSSTTPSSTSCSVLSFSGESGSDTSGGGGGKINNSGTAAAGGSFDYIADREFRGNTKASYEIRATEGEKNKIEGKSAKEADQYGLGGGGGYTPVWSDGTSGTVGAGGDGGYGNVQMNFKIIIPGSGGGSGIRVGGVNESNNKEYEIKYKVQEGKRIIIRVGSGGSSGSQSQDGTSGQASTIGEDGIVFFAGENGKTISFEQKTDLDNCIKNRYDTNTKYTNDDINYCVSRYKPEGGKASIVDQYDKYKSSSQNHPYFKDSTTIYSMTLTSAKGTDGKQPVMNYRNNGDVYWNYGFDGGVGGAPFGVLPRDVTKAIACGGGSGPEPITGTETNLSQYICVSGHKDGMNAPSHDPINNKFGGSGGAGGGIIPGSNEPGSGGIGSSGYIRVRWDESENDSE